MWVNAKLFWHHHHRHRRQQQHVKITQKWEKWENDLSNFAIFTRLRHRLRCGLNCDRVRNSHRAAWKLVVDVSSDRTNRFWMEEIMRFFFLQQQSPRAQSPTVVVNIHSHMLAKLHAANAIREFGIYDANRSETSHTLLPWHANFLQRPLPEIRVFCFLRRGHNTHGKTRGSPFSESLLPHCGCKCNSFLPSCCYCFFFCNQSVCLPLLEVFQRHWLWIELVIVWQRISIEGRLNTAQSKLPMIVFIAFRRQHFWHFTFYLRFYLSHVEWPRSLSPLLFYLLCNDQTPQIT